MKLDSHFPNVDVVIVTWNKKDDVVSLLRQLENFDYPDDKLNITVVDNHSSDGTATTIKKDFPSINLIINEDNLGGAGGFNAGMRWVLANKPDTQYLWLLDNDVQLDKKALIELVTVMENNPDAAICGSKIVNIDDHDDVIEVGAFIDYKKGGVKSNKPEDNKKICQKDIFEVDYVAACSLLARVSSVKKLDVWHEDFFIYWDDMEWGARFKKSGYRVLASNKSIVYHPSWIARTIDNSAIWRNYYRTRNSLWFFNHYTSGFQRFILLARIIVRSMRWALYALLEANPTLSNAYMMGISDFFHGKYGKKTIALPGYDLDEYMQNFSNISICIFIPDEKISKTAEKYFYTVKKYKQGVKVIAVVPEKEKYKWVDIAGQDNIITFRQKKSRFGSLLEKVKIISFLKKRKWDLLFSPPVPPKLGTIWGKDVVRIDYENNIAIMIDRIDIRLLCKVPVCFIRYILCLIWDCNKILKEKTL
jgi:GT2 family glycosyltransferase